MKRRDKQISMKVNSDLFDKFNQIIDKYTSKFDFGYKIYYRCIFPDKIYNYNKYSISDLLEDALYDFIKKYENFDN